jgi:hypothetical protein
MEPCPPLMKIMPGRIEVAYLLRQSHKMYPPSKLRTYLYICGCINTVQYYAASAENIPVPYAIWLETVAVSYCIVNLNNPGKAVSIMMVGKTV